MDIVDNRLWTCIAKCSECHKELNRAEHVPTEKKNWVEMTAPLNTANCEEHQTFSDCNLHFELEWIEELPNG